LVKLGVQEELLQRLRASPTHGLTSVREAFDPASRGGEGPINKSRRRRNGPARRTTRGIASIRPGAAQPPVSALDIRAYRLPKMRLDLPASRTRAGGGNARSAAQALFWGVLLLRLAGEVAAPG
jgi:hypothetical protein